MTHMKEFELYLKGRLIFMDKQRRGCGVDHEVDLAYSELMYIFANILPQLREDNNDKLRNLERRKIRRV